MKTVFLLGRLLFGGFFLYNGIHHIRNRREMAQYASAKHVPMPEAAVTGSGALLLVGGTSALLGVKPKWGMLALLAFLAGVSPVMHDFWNAHDANQGQNDMINFAKNVALMGAALALLGMREPWPVSVPVGQPTKMERVRRFAREIAA